MPEPTNTGGGAGFLQDWKKDARDVIQFNPWELAWMAPDEHLLRVGIVMVYYLEDDFEGMVKPLMKALAEVGKRFNFFRSKNNQLWVHLIPLSSVSEMLRKVQEEGHDGVFYLFDIKLKGDVGGNGITALVKTRKHRRKAFLVLRATYAATSVEDPDSGGFQAANIAWPKDIKPEETAHLIYEYVAFWPATPICGSCRMFVQAPAGKKSGRCLFRGTADTIYARNTSATICHWIHLERLEEAYKQAVEESKDSPNGPYRSETLENYLKEIHRLFPSKESVLRIANEYLATKELPPIDALPDGENAVYAALEAIEERFTASRKYSSSFGGEHFVENNPMVQHPRTFRALNTRYLATSGLRPAKVPSVVLPTVIENDLREHHITLE